MGQFRARRRLIVVAGAAALLSASATAAPTGTPVPPPPPGPGGCRGPSCTPAVPRDELVMSIPAASPHQSAGSFDTPLIDTSNLVVQPGDVDVGVTSGADSSTWDSFAVATTNRYQSCVSETGANAKDRPTQAVCESPSRQDSRQ